MYWVLLPSIKIRIPWDIVLIKQVLPEFMPFLLGEGDKYNFFYSASENM